MLLNISDARFKLIAVIVAVALIAPMVLMPAGAASAGESNDKSNTITLLVEPSKEMIEVINSKGAEIEIIEEENMPVIVVPYCCSIGEEIYLPFKLPATMEVLYGDKVVTVEVEGNYLLIPIEGEIERVCISDFDVREIRDGQIVLESEINPWMVLRVTLGLIKFGYYAYRELTTRHFDHAEVKRWLYGNSSPVYAEFDLFRGRAEQLAKVQFKELTVSVGVRDLDHGEKVIAYLIGEKTGEKIKLDREFPTIGDRVIGATILRVKGADMSPVCIFLRENEGRVTVKLEKESWGAVWIEGVTLGIDW